MSKILKIVLIILISIAVVLGLLYYFFIYQESGMGITDENGDFRPPRFFPFGGDNPDEDNTERETDPEEEIQNIEQAQRRLPQLRQLTESPVSGATFALKNGELAIRYVDRGTGHIFDKYATSTKEERVTNTTIPKTREVFWASDDSLLLRYLAEDDETIETFSANIVISETQGTTTDSAPPVGQITGDFLGANIYYVAENQMGGGVFYLRPLQDGVEGIITNESLNNLSSVFTNPLKDWLVSWPNENVVTFKTKPSQNSYGNLFFLNLQDGSFEHVTGGPTGFVTNTSPDINKVIQTSGVNTMVLDLETMKFSQTNLRTIAEKCVWTNDSTFFYCGADSGINNEQMPDLWYQGVVSFDDNVVKVNSETLETEIVVNPHDFEANIDVFNPKIDGTNSFLLFTNKNDLTLWLLRLPGVVEF